MTIEEAGPPTIRLVGNSDERDPAPDASGSAGRRDRREGLHAPVRVLAPDVRLRYLIPSGPGRSPVRPTWPAGSSSGSATPPSSRRPGGPGRAALRPDVGPYRFLLREGPDWEVVEQQAYLDVDVDGRIAAIDLLCSGFRPADGRAGGSAMGTHEFDAGAMGCADGLAPEFRRRIGRSRSATSSW